jgi:hypothetical protein
MKPIQAIWRFISASWLVAAPLVILVLLVGVFALLGIICAIIEHVLGPETADNFLANAMVLLTIAFELALLGLVIYGIFCIARWLVSKKAP